MNPLVSPEWLAARINDPDVVILDATLPPVGVKPAPDMRAKYLEQHIPGAVFFDIDELSDHSTPLPHMLPAPEEFAKSMDALGIANDATLVVYEQNPVFSAPRALWMLRTFGAGNVRLLDGGLKAWLAAGLPTESGEVKRSRAVFHVEQNHDAVKSFDDIRNLIAQHAQDSSQGNAQGNAQILDARSAARFTGAAPEPRPGLSSGHMPGAVSVPFTELFAEDGRLKSPEQLRELFAAKHIDLARPITTTCGSGVTAAAVALAAELAGARDITLYDGSWAEYASRPEAVIEKDA